MNKLKIAELALSRGSHKSPQEGMCVMEVISYVSGEPFSDHPECACPVVSAFLRRWNDGMNDTDRQMLKSLIPALIGSRATAYVGKKRLDLILDWCFRTNTPTWLDLAGLHKEAEQGRNLGMNANWQKIKAAAYAAYAICVAHSSSRPTVVKLQKSALQLIKDCLAIRI